MKTSPPVDPPRVRPSGFFVVRAPLLPIDVLKSLGADLEAAHVDGDEAVERDIARVTERVRELVGRPEVREAIFLASPSLDAARRAWLADPSSARAAGFFPAALRYLARMSARPTPFGLFSGCALGALGDATALDSGDATLRRHTRLDVHYLAALTHALERDPALAAALVFEPSNGVVRADDALRYAEASVDPTTRERSLHLVSVERSEALDDTLARAAGGARLADLAAALCRGNVAREEADAYVDELVRAQLLTSSIAPPVTGDDPLDAVIQALDQASGVEADGARPARSARDALRAVREDLAALDREGLGHAPERYASVAERLRELPAAVDPSRLFHVDLFRDDAGLSLGPAQVELVEEALAASLAVSPPRAADEALRTFHEAFEERYGQREVALGEALDAERGIGFPAGGDGDDVAPLLDGIPLRAREAAGPSLRARDRFLARRVEACARSKSREWVLDADDLRALGDGPIDAALPDALAVFGRFVRSDGGDDAVWFSLAAVVGPSGATLLGRFCHGAPALAAAVRAHLADEEGLRPERLFAEIVHLPEGRAGNVLCRPLLRRYEIPLYGRSGAPPDRQIHLSDLLVSVRGGRLTLRSRALDREVVPRMTTAHNPDSTGLGAYRFLCALQAAERPGAGFSWGAAELTSTWLPRVRLGRVVLAPARWRIPAGELRGCCEGSAARRFRAVQSLRSKFDLPRWVGVGDGDNVLPVDLDNPCLVDAAATLFKGPGDVVFVEAQGVTAAALSRGPRGTFAHEVVVPFTRARAPSPPPGAAPRGAAPRTFPPGSEWLYAKLYCGTAAADAALAEVVRPLLDEAAALGCDRWFFLRYADPHPHLRVRLRGAPPALWGAVLPRLRHALQPWIADGRVHRLALDTYDRELERYGGDAGIDLAEEFFQVDSELALGLIERSRGDLGAHVRWRLALSVMHQILTRFVPDRGDALALVLDARAAFADELRVDAAVDAQLGRRFRAERAEVARLCDGGPSAALPEAGEVFEACAARLSDLAQRFARAALDAPRRDIVRSFLHMHVNRMMLSKQRAQEFVLYDLLRRHYESEVARARKG